MHTGISEHRIRWPFCDETMVVLLDVSAGDQSYVEDCQVCCQPMQINFEVIEDSPCEVDVGCA